MKLKKLLSAGLASAMLFSASILPTATAADMPFDDVKENDWFHGAVQFVYDNGIMKGVDDGVFSPNGNLTRAEFVTILCRMSDGVEKVTDTFTDVPAGEWYAGYIGWGADTGVVNGYEDHTFKPNAPMSRQEMAAAMVRYIDYRGINLPRENFAPYVFTDDESIDEWAEDYIDVLRISGIVAGDQDVNYNPQNNISRAEAATIIQRLYGVIDKAWQGYIPSPEDEAIILGAKYLYWGGTVVQGKLYSRMAENSGAYPALAAYVKTDIIKDLSSKDPEGTIGVSTTVAEIELKDHPIVKICYDYSGYTAPTTLEGAVNVNSEENLAGRHIRETFTYTSGADDEGYKTATADLTSILKAHPGMDNSVDFIHVLAKPFSDGYEGNGEFRIRYMGFFKDQASADAFTSADQSDYLKNYFVYTNINYKEFSSEVEKELDALLERRINEIRNSASAVTPADIEAAGGKCYYVSSINGNDANDGTSPEKAWKSLSALYYKKGPVMLCYAKEGDGIFFERGSEFYPEIYMNNSTRTLETTAGVTYGAYGKGEKPAFYGAIDFTNKNNGAGVWLKTDYNNIWVLDEIDAKSDWCGARSEVGNIAFNDGEFLGVRIKSSNENDPFGPDRYANVYLTLGNHAATNEVSNGEEIYVISERPCNNIGDALQHNLEFMHDLKNGKLYLYFDKGNPGEYFNDIKCSKNTTIISLNGKNVTIDNLAVLYSGVHGMQGTPEENIRITNCEVGYAYGNTVETGIEIYGATDGVYIGNCYVHDTGGALTCQNGSTPNNGKQYDIKNVEYANNVVTSSVTGNENWNSLGVADENGHYQGRMINQYIHDNIFAYMGYSRTKITPPSASGNPVDGSAFSDHENCIFENNTIFYGAGYIYYCNLSTDKHTSSWQTRNNTYVFNPEHQVFQMSFETINTVNNLKDKRDRHSTPMDYRYLVFYTSNGVDPSGTYYWYDTATERRIINEWLLGK